jgi:hypothetical protein
MVSEAMASVAAAVLAAEDTDDESWLCQYEGEGCLFQHASCSVVEAHERSCTRRPGDRQAALATVDEGSERLRAGSTLDLREAPPPHPDDDAPDCDGVQITDWIAPFACHDYPVGGAPSVNSRQSADVSLAPVADEFTRASTTALEGGLVGDATMEEAEEYLKPIRDSGKVPTPWLESVAKQVQPLREWWRCIGETMTETAAGTATRRLGLQAMLRAAVEAASVDELSEVVDSIYSWSDTWCNREEHLRQAMHS